MKKNEMSQKEAELKEEVRKMKHFIEREICEIELERQNNRKLFSYEGQATFNNMKKQIETLQSALSSSQAEVNELKEFIKRRSEEALKEKV